MIQRLVAILTVLVLSIGVAGWTAVHVRLAHGQLTQCDGGTCCASAPMVEQCRGHSTCSDHHEATDLQPDQPLGGGEGEEHSPLERQIPTDRDSDCGDCSLLAVVVMLSSSVLPLDHVALAHWASGGIPVWSASVPSPRGIRARPPPLVS